MTEPKVNKFAPVWVCWTSYLSICVQKCELCYSFLRELEKRNEILRPTMAYGDLKRSQLRSRRARAPIFCGTRYEIISGRRRLGFVHVVGLNFNANMAAHCFFLN